MKKNQIVYFMHDNEICIGIINKIYNSEKLPRTKVADLTYYNCEFIGEPIDSITIPVARLFDNSIDLINLLKNELKIAKKDFLKIIKV